MKAIGFYLKSFLFVVFSLAIQAEIHASHNAGGEITFKKVDSLKYDVFVTYYRDCRGIALTIPDLKVLPLTRSNSIKFTLTRISIEKVSTSCNPQYACEPPNSSGASGGAYEKHTFKTQLDFSSGQLSTWAKAGTCSFYLETSQCCRAGAINSGPSGQFYIYSMLNICVDGPLDMNFATDIHNEMCCNQPFQGSTGLLNNQLKDSISYSMASPLKGWNNASSYSGNYSKNRPFQVYDPFGSGKVNPAANPPTGYYFNVETGDMVFTPVKCNEITVACFKIQRWRKDTSGTYQLAAEVHRENIYIVTHCKGNHPPTFSSYGGSRSIGFVENGCDDKVCFDVDVDDNIYIPPSGVKPPPDSVKFISLEYPTGVEVEILNKGRLYEKARVCVNLDKLESRSYPIPVVLQIRDDNCPNFAIATKTFVVSVKAVDSSGLVQVEVIEDANRNGVKDTLEGAPIVARKLAVYANRTQLEYQYLSKAGKANFCTPIGKNSVRLKPSPYYNDHLKDTTFNVEYDSIHEVLLGCTLKPGVIGTVRGYKATNCSASSTYPVQGMKVMALPGPYYATTDKDGRYFMKLPTGSYKLKLVSNTDWNGSKCQDSIEVKVSKWNETYILDDVLYAVQEKYLSERDPRITIKSSYAIRRGIKKDGHVKVEVTNPYQDFTDSIGITVKFQDSLNLDTFPSPWTDIGGGKAFLKIPSLKSGSKVVGEFKFTAGAKHFVSGDQIVVTASLDLDSNQNKDYDTLNNIRQTKLVVFAPYDPNIKLTAQDSIFTVTNRRLDYTVHFQNTGNAPAQDVVVLDTLPSDFDLGSLNVLGGSHNFQYSLVDGVLWFDFENINLPDSGTDHEGSKGWVSFSLELKSDIYKKKTIKNRVGIYFDFEEVVLTNYHTNHFKSPTEFLKKEVSACPNLNLNIPFSTTFTPKAGNAFILEISKNQRFDEVAFQDTLNSANKADSFKIRIPDNMDAGRYFMRIRSTDESTVTFMEEYAYLNVTRYDHYAINDFQNPICAGNLTQLSGNIEFKSQGLFVNNIESHVSKDSIFNPVEFFNLDSIYLKGQTEIGCVVYTDTIEIRVFGRARDNSTYAIYRNLDSICEGNRAAVAANMSFTKQQLYVNGQAIRTSNDSLFEDVKFEDKDAIHVIGETETGCLVYSDTVQVTVHYPYAAIMDMDSVICHPINRIDLKHESVKGDSKDQLDSLFWLYGNRSTIAELSFGELGKLDLDSGANELKLVTQTDFRCRDTTSMTIHAFVKPIIKHALSADTLCQYGSNSLLDNTSVLIGNSFNTMISWEKDVKNDKKDHQYNTAGSYAVKVISTDEFGCSDSSLLSHEVVGLPVFSTVLNSDADQCLNQNAYTANVVSSEKNDYVWTTEGKTKEGEDFFHSYASPGVKKIKCVAKNSFGCWDSTIHFVDVLPLPNLVYEEFPDSSCLSDVVEFKGMDLKAGYQYRWKFDSEEVNSGIVQKTFDSSGLVQIKFIGITNNNCQDTVEDEIHILELPIAQFKVDYGEFDKREFVFTNVSQNASTYTWTFDQVEINTRNKEDQISHRFERDGESVATLVAQNDIGCPDTSEMILLVFTEYEVRGMNPLILSQDRMGADIRVFPKSRIESIQFTMYNSVGQMVYNSEAETSIKLPSLATGSYHYNFVITDSYGDVHHMNGNLMIISR